MSTQSAFWEDLARDLGDPEFLRQYVSESVRIATIDAVINALDTARIEGGLSKAALARAINAEPAAIRRMFSGARGNPTLGTLAAVSAALGLRVTLEPLTKAEREMITESLRHGRTTKAHELIATAETRRRLATS